MQMRPSSNYILQGISGAVSTIYWQHLPTNHCVVCIHTNHKAGLFRNRLYYGKMAVEATPINQSPY